MSTRFDLISHGVTPSGEPFVVRTARVFMEGTFFTCAWPAKNTHYEYLGFRAEKTTEELAITHHFEVLRLLGENEYGAICTGTVGSALAPDTIIPGVNFKAG